MPTFQKLQIKIGDLVTVCSGFHKNKTGEVMKIDKKTGRILVQGINLKMKHIKRKTKNEKSEIRKIEGFIHHSNVKLNLKK